MRQTWILLALAALMPCGARAEQADTLRVVELQDVVVRGVRAPKNAPFAVTGVDKTALTAFGKTGRELPFLLQNTPGVMAWSENGLGTGTTHLRIRGASESRINVTLDGVALNSPEDQCVFWANMNSYASLLGSAQIQRGIGSSTAGDGAFGGNVSLALAAPALTPSLVMNVGYGSYNTLNVGANLSTGLLWSHLTLDAAYHMTRTDGYLHGTEGHSGSYYGALTWTDDNLTLSYKNLGNFENTGQAWNGVTAGNDDATLMDDGIATYRDMYRRGLGRYNSLYESIVFDEDQWAFPTDKNGNYQTRRYQMRDGSLWDKTTDQFYQNHNILSAVWTPTARWSHHMALHYTYGHGCYEEFRPQNKLAKFGLTYYDDGNPVKRTDFVRRKGLTQHAYGLVYNADYRGERMDLTMGTYLQQFRGGHFGYLTYIAHEGLDRQTRAGGDYKYYDSGARKDDYSAYAKATLHITGEWDVFADLQYRHVGYRTDGVNDKFLKQEDGSYRNQALNVREYYNFVNPKAGISYHSGPHRAYASVAYAGREPERNNFTDNGNYPAPNAEHMVDIEAGYGYTAKTWSAGAGLYYMGYKDQFVQTGEKSEIGENLTTNIPKSYRMGVELTAEYSPLPWLTVSGNAAFSVNRLKDFTEYVENWDGEPLQVHYDHSPLAFSPATILNGFLTVRHGGLTATLHENFVSRQYLDNTGSTARALPCYAQTNLSVSYTLRRLPAVKEAVLGLNLYNLMDRHYASSGWVYSAVSESSGYTADNRYYQIGFMPMAGFTMMGTLTVKF